MKQALTQEEINVQLLLSALKTKATLVVLTELLVKTHSKIANINEAELLISTSKEILEVERQLYLAVFDV